MCGCAHTNVRLHSESCVSFHMFCSVIHLISVSQQKRHWPVDNEKFRDIYCVLQMQKRDISGRKLKTQSDAAPRPCSPSEFDTLEVNTDIFQVICQVFLHS